MMTTKRFELWDADQAMLLDRDLDLAEFFVLNDMEPEEANAIGDLPVGGVCRLGGGAAPLFDVRRVA